jgi:hypothetical protein
VWYPHVTSAELTSHIKKVKEGDLGRSVSLLVNERDVRTDSEIVCFDSSFELNKGQAEIMKDLFKFSPNKPIKRPKDLPTAVDKSVRNLIIAPFTI